MAGPGLRSVVVAWLRVLLPLAALALLSTLFLLSRHPDPDRAIPYARVDAEALARDPRITQPSYAGVTPDGARLALAADTATPAPGGGVSGARGLRLDWTAPDGLTARLTAPEVSLGTRAVTLAGGVALETSSGWRLAAPRIEAATDRSRIAASGGVAATAPFGEITAAEAVLRPAGEGGPAGSQLLDFTGGVRLIYRP